MGLFRLSKSEIDTVYGEIEKASEQEGAEDVVLACMTSIRPIVRKVILGAARASVIEKLLLSRNFDRANRIVRDEVARGFKTITILSILVFVFALAMLVAVFE
ncbi:MAG: hypothetical protein DRI90_13375 [Deltaproteobacteria bacterium]|nr:MAG: hypothetical protein DRI90_13375 [Deltaproteobacteria bacterium]